MNEIFPVITIETMVNKEIQHVWDCWTKPEHITGWNFASFDWHCPSAKNDLKKGGVFSYRMEARDGSFGFDFGGNYEEVIPLEFISFVMGDGRHVKIQFLDFKYSVKIIESFEAENQNSLELQKTGWQAILDNFKKYAESR